MNTKMKLILVLASFTVMAASYAGNDTVPAPSRPGDRETIDHFGRNVFFTAGCSFSDAVDLKDKKIDDVFYYEIAKIHPGQATFSELNTEEKLEKIKKAQKKYAKEHDGNFLAFDDGKSTYPLEKALPVYNTPWGLILINGHHRTIASKRLGATTVPVLIIKDVTNLQVSELEDFRTKMDPIDARGNRVRMPCNMDQLAQPENDDPNRYFVKISAYQGKKPTGTTHPLWIPIGKYFGHQEFVIDILLNQKGLAYKNEYGSKIPDAFLENARHILTNPENKFQQKDRVCVIKHRVHYKDVTYIDENTCPEKYKLGY